MSSSTVTGDPPLWSTTTTLPAVTTSGYATVDVTNGQNFAIRKQRINLYPDLLAERVQKYSVVMPPWAPVYDRLLLYVLPDSDLPEKVGGLYMPAQAVSKHSARRGLLVKAGARAIEELYSHGIELGQILIAAHLTPWEREYATPQGVGRVLVLRTPDIVGSEDLDREFAAGNLWLERDSNGRVELADRQRVDPAGNDEGI